MGSKENAFAAPRPNILIAGLFHETNTFVEGRVEESDFEVLEAGRLLAAAGSGSPLAGALETASAFGWNVFPAIDMRAMPGPIVSDQVVERFLAAVESTALGASPALAGALLIFHGAMVSETIEDVEGHVLQRIRALLGNEAVICMVLDLHGNVTERMSTFADLMVAYRTNPHADAHDASVRAARLLQRVLQRRERPRVFWALTDILWPPAGTETASDPMATLEAQAREIEAADPQVLAFDVFAGFAFADVRDAGVSFTCVSVGDAETAKAHLDSMRRLAASLREKGNALDLPLPEVMKGLCPDGTGPILLVETADNIGAGASGRGLGVAKALVRLGIQNAAVAIQAPEIVAQLEAVSVGESVSIRLVDPFDPGPLDLDVTLCSKSQGCFELEDPRSHLASMLGKVIDMGPCAVVRAGGVRFLLTSRRTPPFDLGQFRSQGIAPEQLSVVGIKAAVAHRKAWGPIASASYNVSTPGPCASDLSLLPYRRLRRPVFPLDMASR